MSGSPVSQFLSGLKLEGDLFPRKHLSPLAHVVRVVCAGALHIRDGVHASAVRQRHPVFTARKHTATVTTSQKVHGIQLQQTFQFEGIEILIEMATPAGRLGNPS